MEIKSQVNTVLSSVSEGEILNRIVLLFKKPAFQQEKVTGYG